MKFNQFVLVQFATPSDFSALPKEETRRLQDAHLAYAADLHDQGLLLAHGGAAGDDRHNRGFALMTCDLGTARDLWAADPAVQARRYILEFDEWLVPQDMIVDGSGRPPRSVAEAQENGIV